MALCELKFNVRDSQRTKMKKKKKKQFRPIRALIFFFLPNTEKPIYDPQNTKKNTLFHLINGIKN